MGSIYTRFESLIEHIMRLFAWCFLALLAIVIQYLQTGTLLNYLSGFEYALALLWFIFPLERIFYLTSCLQKTWKNYLTALFVSLLPPFRFITRRCTLPLYIWWQGQWQPANQILYLRIEKQFSYPILFISLMMVPFWIVEIIVPDRLITLSLLYHAINFGNAVVWGLFVAEYIFLLALTNNRKKYVLRRWLELLVILLPIIAAARLFNSVRLLKALKLNKLLNIYRARSVVNRLRIIINIIALFNRWYQQRNPEKYLKKLHEQLASKYEEMAEIEEDIIELEKRIKEVELIIQTKETQNH